MYVRTCLYILLGHTYKHRRGYLVQQEIDSFIKYEIGNAQRGQDALSPDTRVDKFSKVSSVVAVNIKYSRALTFENLYPNPILCPLRISVALNNACVFTQSRACL